jgi:multidrug resistance efflux pump
MKKIAVFSIVFLLFSCAKSESKITPTKRNLTESVYTSVIIQPDSLYQVYPSVVGLLEQNLVEEGEVVYKDTPLVQIVNTTPKLTTQNAKLSLELAKENYMGTAAVLSEIEEEIRAANLTYQSVASNFFRQKNLWNQKIGSKVEFDAKKLTYELSQDSLQLLKSKYNRIKNELKTALRKAQNNYQSSLINTEYFTVKSLISGKVYALYKKPGEIVSTMEPLASIGSNTVFIIEMLVDEVDIVKIAKNQKVIVRLDAYQGSIFTEKVSKIYPKKDERNQTFKVDALFDKIPKILYPGLSGEANIVISKKSDALTIPREYLIDLDKVKTDSGIVKIITGLQNMEFVEVLSGITKKKHLNLQTRIMTN